MDKPVWVFVVGSYRTGSTTQFMLADELVQRSRTGKGIGYHTEDRLEEHDRTASPGYIVCKVFKYLPETSAHGARFLKEGRVRAIGTCRDPRDIMVSMNTRAKKQNDASWNFQEVVVNQLPVWLRQFNQWADLGPELSMITKFEDMTLNLFREVARISRFLGIEISRAEMGQIAKSHTVMSLNRRKSKYFATRNDGDREHPTLPSIPSVEFGSSGHWRTWLSTAEIRLIEKHAAFYMDRWGYG